MTKNDQKSYKPEHHTLCQHAWKRTPILAKLGTVAVVLTFCNEQQLPNIRPLDPAVVPTGSAAQLSSLEPRGEHQLLASFVAQEAGTACFARNAHCTFCCCVCAHNL